MYYIYKEIYHLTFWPNLPIYAALRLIGKFTKWNFVCHLKFL